MASTFPRWEGDEQPRFILDLCKNIPGRLKFLVLAPHYPGAKTRETIEGVDVVRFRYAPERYEKLAYDGGMLEQIRGNKLRVVLLPFFLASMFLYVLLLRKKHRCKLIHAHWLVPQGVVAALAIATARLNSKLIVTCHGADLHSLKGPLWKIVKRWVLKRSTRITVVSHAMKRLIGELAADSVHKTFVAPMGTDLAGLFKPKIAPTSSLRPSLLFVGRLVEKKGLIYLLKAMPEILQKYPDTVLTVVGDGPLRGSLQRYVQKAALSGAVEFKGAVEHTRLPAFYTSASAAIFPFVEAGDGNQEGFGLVLVEAQGCHCPIIASDMPPLEDTVVGDQRYWLCAPADPDALANKVCELLSESRAARRHRLQGAREYVVSNFDWQRIGVRYNNIYHM